MKDRSKVLLVAGILSVVYLGWFIANTFIGTAAAVMAADEMMSTGTEAEAAGVAIAATLVAGAAMLFAVPHFILALFGSIFNLVALGTKRSGFAIAAAVLFTVASVLWFPSILFSAAVFILQYVGASMQKKLNQA